MHLETDLQISFLFILLMKFILNTDDNEKRKLFIQFSQQDFSRGWGGYGLYASVAALEFFMSLYWKEDLVLHHFIFLSNT